MDISISNSTLRSLKNSFANILAFVVQENGSDTQKITCLTKWGAQLGFRQAELHRLILSPSLLKYEAPANNIDALSQVYDLVYMVYMDGVIEDVELDLVSLYATGIGLEAYVVNDLLKALVSAQIDGIPNEEIRLDLKAHPEVYL